jgi:Fe-S cluster assembly scaffold protein SufB
MNQFTDSALTPLAGDEPAAWSEARRAALKRHTEFDAPIIDVEAWRHNTLKGFSLDAFEPGTEDVAFEGADAVREVGGIVATLPEAIGDERVLKALLAADWPDSEAFFTTLGTAFATAGAVVLVPKGKIIEEPIVLQRTLPQHGKAVFPLTLVILEENSSATVIDRAKSELGDAASLAVHPTYLSVGDASQLSYLAIQDYSNDVWHFAPTRAKIGRDATVRTMIASLGGKHSRCVT